MSARHLSSIAAKTAHTAPRLIAKPKAFFTRTNKLWIAYVGLYSFDWH